MGAASRIRSMSAGGRLCRWLAAACVLALLSQPALAASLQVSPILLEFAPQEQTQALWLRNTGSVPLRAQVRVQRWTQAEGEDQLASTRELVASPAMVEVAPGERQLVRIVRPQLAPIAQEQAYRLIVDELPGDRQEESSGLQFLLRYSIPVFIGTPTPGRPAPSSTPTDISTLSASLQDGQLHVANQGGRRVRISQLVWANPDASRIPLVPGLLGYVLAGQQMRWPMALPDTADPGGALMAKFDDDSEEQRLPLLAPVR